jgi:hypothetical protein
MGEKAAPKKGGFTPISLDRYVELYLKDNPDASREEIIEALTDALQAYRRGVTCECGSPIWVVGSAVAGYACFTCITGEAYPEDDYEIDEACGQP